MATVTYYVVQAFDADEEGNLIPRPAVAAQSAAAARRMAVGMQDDVAGVVAFSRDADPEAGDYGPPTILYQSGRIPDDME